MVTKSDNFTFCFRLRRKRIAFRSLRWKLNCQLALFLNFILLHIILLLLKKGRIVIDGRLIWSFLSCGLGRIWDAFFLFFLLSPQFYQIKNTGFLAIVIDGGLLLSFLLLYNVFKNDAYKILTLNDIFYWVFHLLWWVMSFYISILLFSLLILKINILNISILCDVLWLNTSCHNFDFGLSPVHSDSCLSTFDMYDQLKLVNIADN